MIPISFTGLTVADLVFPWYVTTSSKITSTLILVFFCYSLALIYSRAPLPYTPNGNKNELLSGLVGDSS